ncbi:MAG: rod shape-determining protein RodA [Alphaproteobacteria bacterium]|nr:rod shape-determining protein RodA [Alphaproteobacteria bacterium]MBU0797507.1 rod shape-determining protein RodA [Alphaproteobacteria bacterium]MBU0889064.1 rod shape-determining protein RodA [Alphaproteobacteria bacterium]MBU1813248.1 rod shape-determining protein RodA [Alphaproteobacteria bacterium]
MSFGLFNNRDMTLGQKLLQMNWMLILLLIVICTVGFAMLYSAANGNWQPWAVRQMMRFSAALGLMVIIALIDVRFWMRWAYVIYLGALALLVVVEVAGDIGMGAQRWIDLGVIQLQPSEVMKVALILGLARYFHGVGHEETARPLMLLLPIAMIGAPALLVLKQPDLGTAGMLIMAGTALLFLAGVRIWKFLLVGGIGLACIPIAWGLLREYQKNRILTFLNPENDPLGAGYHIIQSQIALGSGGVFGKGFLQGSQSHLQFLPEKQTDFIFTMLAEEFGLAGATGLIGLYVLVICYGFAIALRARSQFARLLALGLTVNFFLYFFINIAMVTGLMPVVGIPLPLISYGGTALLTLMIGFGLLMGVYIHRDLRIGRSGIDED